MQYVMCNINVSRVQCNMPWCAQWMFVGITWYALVCKMNVCKYHVICFGVKMNVCMYHACLLYCHELAGTIVLTLQLARIAKVVTENELKRSLFFTIAQKCYPCILHLVYSLFRSPFQLLVSPCYRPLVGQHKVATQDGGKRVNIWGENKWVEDLEGLW